jgi:hypothetical protein
VDSELSLERREPVGYLPPLTLLSSAASESGPSAAWPEPKEAELFQAAAEPVALKPQEQEALVEQARRHMPTTPGASVD